MKVERASVPYSSDCYRGCMAEETEEHRTGSDREAAESSHQDNFRTICECMSKITRAALDLLWDWRLDKVMFQGPFFNETCPL